MCLEQLQLVSFLIVRLFLMYFFHSILLSIIVSVHESNRPSSISRLNFEVIVSAVTSLHQQVEACLRHDLGKPHFREGITTSITNSI